MSGKNLLVVVDMQNDFIGGALGTKEAQDILPAVRARIALARERGETVAFTRDTHGEDYLSTQEGKNLPVEHCLRGSSGWQIAEGLAEEGDAVFDKPAFGSTELAEFVGKIVLRARNLSACARIYASFPTRCLSRRSARKRKLPCGRNAAPASRPQATKTPLPPWPPAR